MANVAVMLWLMRWILPALVLVSACSDPAVQGAGDGDGDVLTTGDAQVVGDSASGVDGSGDHDAAAGDADVPPQDGGLSPDSEEVVEAGVDDVSQADDAAPDHTGDVAVDTVAVDAVSDAQSSQDAGDTEYMVWWSVNHVTPMNQLGWIDTDNFHWATLAFDLPDCSFRMKTQSLPKGWSGSVVIDIDSSNATCFRVGGSCTEQIRVRWSSCDSQDCGSSHSGPGWDTYRPSCVGMPIPDTGALAFRLTIEGGSDGFDETWEVVTPTP